MSKKFKAKNTVQMSYSYSSKWKKAFETTEWERVVSDSQVLTKIRVKVSDIAELCENYLVCYTVSSSAAVEISNDTSLVLHAHESIGTRVLIFS